MERKDTAKATCNNGAFLLTIYIVELIDALDPCHNANTQPPPEIQRIINVL